MKLPGIFNRKGIYLMELVLYMVIAGVIGLTIGSFWVYQYKISNVLEKNNQTFVQISQLTSLFEREFKDCVAIKEIDSNRVIYITKGFNEKNISVSGNSLNINGSNFKLIPSLKISFEDATREISNNYTHPVLIKITFTYTKFSLKNNTTKNIPLYLAIGQ